LTPLTPTDTPPAAAAATPQEPSGPRRPRVLCVDDESQILESLRDSLRRRFDVVSTTNGFEALRILAEERCDVVLSDMRMPMINGARFLTLAREHAPDTVRLMLTGESSIDSAISAVNEGEIFRFLIKPCPTTDLIAAIGDAARRHETLARERQDREQTLAGTLHSLTGLAKAIDPTSPVRAERIRRQAVQLAEAAAAVDGTWELERACELVQVGAAALSAETRAQLAAGRRLNREQGAELERLPELAAPFVRGIPCLTDVAWVIATAAEPFETTRPGLAGTPPAARVLRIVHDFEVLTRLGVPPEAAARDMQQRGGRYDDAILATFAELRRPS
jgi:response regulator RpfG family c-di-GMP phosphodiesterase